MNLTILSIILVNIGNVLGALGSLFIKKGADKFRLNLKSIVKNREIVFGVLFYGVATVLFVPALKFAPLSILYPFVALTYVWITFFSIKFLKEKMNSFKWIGIILIMIGVTFIGLGSG